MKRKKFINLHSRDVDWGLASVSTNIVAMMIYQSMSAWINLLVSYVDALFINQVSGPNTEF